MTLRAEAPAFCMPPPGLPPLCSDEKAEVPLSPWSCSTVASTPTLSSWGSSFSVNSESFGIDYQGWLPENAYYEKSQDSVDYSSSNFEVTDAHDAELSSAPPECHTSPVQEFKLAATKDLQQTLASLLAAMATKTTSVSQAEAESTNAATSDESCSQASTPTDEEAPPKPSCRWGVQTSKSAEKEDSLEDTRQTTVMMNNVPKKCTREQFAKTLNEAGFEGEYDFLYVMADLQQRNCGSGSALVNFRSEEVRERFVTNFHRKGANAVFPGIGGKKAIEVVIAPIQGREANVQKLGKSTLLMSFLEERPGWQPALFGSDGRLEAEVNGN